MKRKLTVITAVVAAFVPAIGWAQLAAPPVASDRMTGGKLLATGGVSQFEGAGGGGLTPWALITGYGTDNQIGANGHYTHIRSESYHLNTYGAALGLYDRLEISVAQQKFDTENVGAALGLGQGYTFRQDILGVKVKLAGNAVLDQDTWLPQISIGAQYKKNNRGAVLGALGVPHDDGVDLYVSATKLYLAQSLLLNTTLRFTKANQTGILGFTGNYKPMLEGSAAVFLSRNWALGAEYRMKPNNLAGFAKEDDWYDVFVAWFPTKNISVTAAYVRLGNIVIRDNQDAAYLSVQLGF